jgi:hypothetical protein
MEESKSELTALRYQLTSRTILPNDGGNYPFYISAILVDHETIRREIYRTEIALRNFDTITHSWKAAYLRRWVNEFLLPSVISIEEVRSQFLFPHYRNHGVNLPQPRGNAAANFLKYSKIFNVLLKSIQKNVTNGSSEVNETNLEEEIRYLRVEFSEFKEFVFRHYAAIESSWPDIIREHKEVIFFRILLNIIFLIFYM